MAAAPSASNPDITSPSSNPAAAPSATITPTHFQHRTTTAAPVNTMIDTATPALNTVPIELDSTPVASPVGRTGSWNIKEAVQDAAAGAQEKIKEALQHKSQGSSEHGVVGHGHGHHKVLDASTSGAAGKLRADSAAVMAGPPGTPGPEDFEAAKVDAITPS